MERNQLNQLVGSIKNRIARSKAKYGSNKPFKAVDESGNQKVIWDGRNCAVSGFIYAIVNDKLSVLANLRGPGTPDYQGCWNAPCGFLERFETSVEGIQREILEECGFYINKYDIEVKETETDPAECNNGNVTIRHTAYLGKIDPMYVNMEGGEKDEVESVKWIPLEDINEYKWAFNHKKTIMKYAPKRWTWKFIEFFNNHILGYNIDYTKGISW